VNIYNLTATRFVVFSGSLA